MFRLNLYGVVIFARRISFLSKKNFHIIFLISICAISYQHWFFDISGVLTDGDWDYISSTKAKGFLDLPNPYTLNEFGGFNYGSSFYPIMVIWGLLSFLFDYALIERIVYLWPASILGFFAPYLLCRKNGISKWASVTGALLFGFNTYMVSSRTGHLTLAVAFGLILIGFSYFIGEPNKISKRRDELIASIFLGISAWYEPRAYLIGLLLFFMYTHQSLLAVVPKNKSVKQKSFLFILSVTILLNSFWLLPYLMQSKANSNFIFTRELFGASYQDLAHAVTSVHPYWNGESFVRFQLQKIPLINWMITAVMLYGGLVYRRDPTIRFFLLVFIVGVILAKQQSEPFGILYELLYKYLPGFSLYRESTKFYFLVALAHSIIVARSISLSSSSYFSAPKNSYILASSIFVFISCINIIYSLQVGKIDDLRTPRIIPKSYIYLNEWIEKNTKNERILWLPQKNRWISHLEVHHPFLTYGNSKEIISQELDGVTNITLDQFIQNSRFIEFLEKNEIAYIGMTYSSLDQDSINATKDFGEYFSILNVMENIGLKIAYQNEDSVILALAKVSTPTDHIAFNQLKPYSKNIFILPDLSNYDTGCLLKLPLIFGSKDWKIFAFDPDADKILKSFNLTEHSDGGRSFDSCEVRAKKYSTVFLIFYPIVYSVLGLLLSFGVLIHIIRELYK